MVQLPVNNPALPTIKNGWKGNPVNEKSRYVNLDGPSERGFADVLRWKLKKNPLQPLKKGQQAGIPIFEDGEFLNDPRDGFTWLGHASFLVTMGGRRIICDPVLYQVSLLKRYTALPCLPEHLKDLDFILLSHNHRDHCDKKSLQLLCAHNPGATLLTGLAMEPLLRRWQIANPIVEMGWYQQYNTDNNPVFTYLPARHWNRRGLTDTNTMLWGSFMIDSGPRRLYFGADSGPGEHFREIGQLFPGIHFALLGIGAYKPEWFMRPSHTGPADALEATLRLGADYLVPMHYGTFDLSDEPVFYAEEELKRITSDRPLVKVLYPGIGRKHYWSNAVTGT